jgi:hypothetical protein
MKNITYKFSFFPQGISALVAFILNAGIPFLLGAPISWVTTIMVTVSVFLSSGIRYRKKA